jgi:hypothetical protein
VWFAVGAVAVVATGFGIWYVQKQRRKTGPVTPEQTPAPAPPARKTGEREPTDEEVCAHLQSIAAASTEFTPELLAVLAAECEQNLVELRARTSDEQYRAYVHCLMAARTVDEVQACTIP